MPDQPHDAATTIRPLKRTRDTTRIVATNKRFDCISVAWHQECVDRSKAGADKILFQDFIDEILAAGLASRPRIVVLDDAAS